MFQILAATRNKHKVEEFKQLLKDKEIEILSLNDIEGSRETEEDGTTFEENAIKKALEASNFAHMPAFADDSGLEVEALDWRPGIHSSRYGGAETSHKDKISMLLEELKLQQNRRARFVCVIAIANEGKVVNTFRGEIYGVITDAPKGDYGFGYDPVFIPEGFDKTFAELPSDVKNKISHRARAVNMAVDFIEDELSTIDGLDI